MTASQTHQVVQRWYQALDRGDVPAALETLSEDIDWEIPRSNDVIPWTGKRRGRAQVLEAFGQRDALVQVQEYKLQSLLAQDDQAVGFVHERSLCKQTGKSFDVDIVQTFRVGDGKIQALKSMCDFVPILAAFRPDGRQLLAAVGADDVEQARRLLRQGADANARDPQTGLTALMLAACHANPAVVRLLLDAGADVFTADSNTGATALHKACQGGSVEVAKMLLDRGAFVDAVAPTTGHTPIMDALWYKWPDMVRLLVDHGANLHLSTHYGFSMMDHFQFELNVNTLGKEKLLEIDRIFKERQAANDRVIAEQVAIARTNAGDTEGVREAVEAGADVNTVYPIVNSFLDGHTPLLVAARDNHREIVELLLKAGAEVRVEDWVFKGAPIHKATYNGNPEILRMLLEAPNIDIDVQGKINGYTPLHDALWHGYADCAIILIEAGARLDLKGHDGKLPIDVATEVLGPDHEVVRLIRSKMAP